MTRTLTLVLALTSTQLLGCKDDAPAASDTGTDEDQGDLPAGSTALVVLLNPIVNVEHATGTPSVAGTVQDAIDVVAMPGGEDTTDETGLAVVEIAVGPTSVAFGAIDKPGTLALDVIAEGDVYDAAVAFDGALAGYFAQTPIRYAVGEPSGAIYIESGTPIGQIEQELTVDDVVVVLRPGVYEGDLEIRGHRVVLFGEGFSGGAVTITGSIEALGEGVRLRGLTIDVDVISAGDGFGMSFSVVRGNASITGDGGAFVRNVFCRAATVPTDDATLLDNVGLAPLLEVPVEPCMPSEDETSN